MATVKGLTEVVILVHDLDKSVSFYQDILGLRVMSPPDVQGASFLQAGESNNGVPQHEGSGSFPQDRMQRPLHHIGFEIDADDYEAERQRLETLGYQLRFGEHPFLPLRGIYLDDPDGNEVELIAPKS